MTLSRALSAVLDGFLGSGGRVFAVALRDRSDPANTSRTAMVRGTDGRNGLKSLRDCPAGEGIEILQEKWVLHIVHALLDGPKGFNELGRVVGGCNPTTLTQRLAKLEDLGVLRRDPGPAGARCDYSLTEAGLGLERVIAAIRTWASAHLRDA